VDKLCLRSSEASKASIQRTNGVAVAGNFGSQAGLALNSKVGEVNVPTPYFRMPLDNLLEFLEGLELT
jgi:hypothetical protein